MHHVLITVITHRFQLKLDAVPLAVLTSNVKYISVTFKISKNEQLNQCCAILTTSVSLATKSSFYIHNIANFFFKVQRFSKFWKKSPTTDGFLLFCFHRKIISLQIYKKKLSRVPPPSTWAFSNFTIFIVIKKKFIIFLDIFD